MNKLNNEEQVCILRNSIDIKLIKIRALEQELKKKMNVILKSSGGRYTKEKLEKMFNIELDNS